jgi:hypothetical protein
VYCADLNLPWDCSLVCSLSAPATCLAWNGAGTDYLLLLRYSTCTRLFGLFYRAADSHLLYDACQAFRFQQNSDTDSEIINVAFDQTKWWYKLVVCQMEPL